MRAARGGGETRFRQHPNYRCQIIDSTGKTRKHESAVDTHIKNLISFTALSWSPVEIKSSSAASQICLQNVYIVPQTRYRRWLIGKRVQPSASRPWLPIHLDGTNESIQTAVH